MSASVEKPTETKQKEKMSPFRVIFGRKKRINGTKSVDDFKTNGKGHNGVSHNKEITPERSVTPPPVPKATTLPAVAKETKQKEKEKEKPKKQLLIGQEKAKSMEALHADDPNYLTEALRTLGDEQPRVARSVPKHAPADNSYSTFAVRSMQNCIYTHEVYEDMMADSLKACDLLQHQLDELIVTVRKSPPRVVEEEPPQVAVQNGH